MGGKATFRRQKQLPNAPLQSPVAFSGSSSENMDIHSYNMLSVITVMRGGTLKLVKMQPMNTSYPNAFDAIVETNGTSEGA